MTTLNMPKTTRFKLAMIGPGIVLIAMGLGSGEFVLWPYLVAEYGFGIIWGAFVGVTLQYFVANETGRYTLATGGSIYTAFYKLGKWIPAWFIVSTFASFAWPGIIGSGGKILAELLGVEEILGLNATAFLTLTMLLIIGLLLTFGGKVYNNLERMQKLFIIIAIPILIIIFAITIDAETPLKVLNGYLGTGEGYSFFPSGISMIAFLGTIAYSGAAGNLILSHSFYVQDKGLGMAKYLDSQVELGSKKKDIPEGKLFEMTEENVNNFNKWFKNTAIEQFISYWFVGLLIITLLIIISYELLYPYTGEEGLEFIFEQGNILKDQFGRVIGNFFLIIGIVFLFTTQLGVFETTSRIMTENIQLSSKKIKNGFTRNNIFFTFLWSQIVVASLITVFQFEQPLQILILSTFFSAVSMFVLSALVLWLNTSHIIPKQIQPPKYRVLMLWISTIFFGLFVAYTIYDLILL